MRKLLRFGACLLIVAFTATCWATPISKKPKFKGFYLGASGGVDSWNVENTIEFFDTDLSTEFPVARNDNNTGRLGGSGGIFLGYGFTEGQTYGSFELNLDVLSNKHNYKTIMSATIGGDNISAEFVISEKQQYGGSLDFHGGYIFNNVALLYFTAGYAVEQFKSTAQYGFSDTALFSGTLSSYSTNTNVSAARIGLGSEFAFQRNWRVRLEAFEKFYSNKSFFLSDITEVQVLTNGNTINATRSYLAYYVGILRQF
jgi:hypothetical protein